MDQPLKGYGKRTETSKLSYTACNLPIHTNSYLMAGASMQGATCCSGPNSHTHSLTAGRAFSRHFGVGCRTEGGRFPANMTIYDLLLLGYNIVKLNIVKTHRACSFVYWINGCKVTLATIWKGIDSFYLLKPWVTLTFTNLIVYVNLTWENWTFWNVLYLCVPKFMFQVLYTMFVDY